MVRTSAWALKPAQAACRSLSIRLSHSPIRFQLANVRPTSLRSLAILRELRLASQPSLLFWRIPGSDAFDAVRIGRRPLELVPAVVAPHDVELLGRTRRTGGRALLRLVDLRAAQDPQSSAAPHAIGWDALAGKPALRHEAASIDRARCAFKVDQYSRNIC